MEERFEFIKQLSHNQLIRFYTGLKFDLIEAEKRFFIFLEWFKKVDLSKVELSSISELDKHKPFLFCGLTRTNNPIILLRVKHFYPNRVSVDDLITYLCKFINDSLDK